MEIALDAAALLDRGFLDPPARDRDLEARDRAVGLKAALLQRHQRGLAGRLDVSLLLGEIGVEEHGGSVLVVATQDHSGSVRVARRHLHGRSVGVHVPAGGARAIGDGERRIAEGLGEHVLDVRGVRSRESVEQVREGPAHEQALEQKPEQDRGGRQERRGQIGAREGAVALPVRGVCDEERDEEHGVAHSDEERRPDHAPHRRRRTNDAVNEQQQGSDAQHHPGELHDRRERAIGDVRDRDEVGRAVRGAAHQRRVKGGLCVGSGPAAPRRRARQAARSDQPSFAARAQPSRGVREKQIAEEDGARPENSRPIVTDGDRNRSTARAWRGGPPPGG